MKMTTTKLLTLCSLIAVAIACASKKTQTQAEMRKESQAASKLVSDATATFNTMEKDPNLQTLIENSHGVFVIPHFTQAAFGVGGKGGEGVLLIKRGDSWSDPVFYNVGGLSLGLQLGAERGALAFILNNEDAVQKFVSQNNFEVSANAGLTVVNYSKAAQADISRADLVAWSNTKGLFGGAAIGLQDVRFDQNETAGFYGKQDVTAADITDGHIKAPQRKTTALKNALTPRSSMTGGSTASPENK